MILSKEEALPWSVDSIVGVNLVPEYGDYTIKWKRINETWSGYSMHRVCRRIASSIHLPIVPVAPVMRMFDPCSRFQISPWAAATRSRSVCGLQLSEASRNSLRPTRCSFNTNLMALFGFSRFHRATVHPLAIFKHADTGFRKFEKYRDLTESTDQIILCFS